MCSESNLVNAWIFLSNIIVKTSHSCTFYRTWQPIFLKKFPGQFIRLNASTFTLLLLMSLVQAANCPWLSGSHSPWGDLKSPVPETSPLMYETRTSGSEPQAVTSLKTLPGVSSVQQACDPLCSQNHTTALSFLLKTDVDYLANQWDKFTGGRINQAKLILSNNYHT